MKNLLEVDSVELTLGDKKILSGIYMKCEAGEVVGLLGRNGSGKSSLLKIVSGMLAAGHKSIRLNGSAVPESKSHRVVRYLPQDDLIPSFLSVREAFDLFEIPFVFIEKEFPEVMEFLRLKPGEVSGGYLRLIESLLILKSPSEFCILDEPFSGLMPLHIERLMKLIGEIKKEKGIIVTDHLYRHIQSVSDRIYLLANGRTYTVHNQEQLVSLGYLHA